MHQESLKAQKRTITGKQACRRIKTAGMVPAVIYGKGSENILVQIDAGLLRKALTTSAGTRVIIDLEVEDGKKTENVQTMVTEVQKDIYKKNYNHVDFHKISLKEKVHTEVPIVLSGDPKGVKAGGVMDHVLWSVPVKALPLDLPEKIKIDVTNMAEGERLHVKDLPIASGVEIMLDPEETVAVIHPPRVSEEAPAAGAEAQPVSA